uniref:RNA-directed RNA polymerase 2a n=1 Tax=Prune dwarf virus TaxID=33760 RepID=A0A7S5VAX6_9BROM|nr:replicase P2 [Prune dwarf virus]
MDSLLEFLLPSRDEDAIELVDTNSVKTSFSLSDSSGDVPPICRSLCQFYGFLMIRDTVVRPDKFSGEFITLPFVIDRLRMTFDLEDDYSFSVDDCSYDLELTDAQLDYAEVLQQQKYFFSESLGKVVVDYDFSLDSEDPSIKDVVKIPDEIPEDFPQENIPAETVADVPQFVSDDVEEQVVAGELIPSCETVNENVRVEVKFPTHLTPRFLATHLPDVDRVVLVDGDTIDGFDKLISRNDWFFLKKLLPNIPLPSDGDVLLSGIKPTSPGVLQFALDELFPYHNLVDDRFFQELVECNDIALELDDCSFDLSHFVSWDKGKSGVDSTLTTGQTSNRQSTFREVALSVKKRNMNVPILNTVLNVEDVSNKIVNRFFETVVDINLLITLPDVISIGEVNYFSDYLKGKAINDDELYVDPICLVSMDKYRHMIKSQLKPVEDNSLMFERPLAATITFHDKGKVMSTSPIFLAAATRLFACLNEKISIPSGKYHQLFSLDAERFDSVRFWKEVDFSKFDKSQQELHHEIQRKIFLRLGVPQEFVNTWFTSHCRSHISDASGLRFSVNYQRRTGDACTYLGNTIVTLAALCYVYDLRSSNVAMVVASGDDSLIGSYSELDRSFEHLFSTLFNFEAKFPHNQPFICSKFLLTMPTRSGGKQVVAVPNPAKLLIKLGVKSMTVDKFDDWFQSWLDLTHYFDDYYLIEVVCSMTSYRYIRRPSQFLVSAISSLKSLFANKKKCKDFLFPGLRDKNPDLPMHLGAPIKIRDDTSKRTRGKKKMKENSHVHIDGKVGG